MIAKEVNKKDKLSYSTPKFEYNSIRFDVLMESPFSLEIGSEFIWE